LLKKHSNDVSTLEKEYDKFAALLFAESHTTSDITAYHDILVYTRVELSCLTEMSKEIYSALSEKAIRLIDIQIAWTERQIISGQSDKHSPLKLKWKGSIMEWVELMYALQTAGCIYHKGKKVTLKQLFSEMGKIFGSCHKSNELIIFVEKKNDSPANDSMQVLRRDRFTEKWEMSKWHSTLFL
jgi:hypothetical protein